ncbi:putative fad binding domain protein [Botrytis fragariae]|uniref:Putative fad binding domain protein n=1 Tax=Botrytis fragariae TaxID=1964551 RepID=A0A8H6EKG1_9HELO|nr:putative fad binding domain protein [Botrytis fragariae]KAF5875551.1 putative fad binding domain protein [Botrytis fragariae]
MFSPLLCLLLSYAFTFVIASSPDLSEQLPLMSGDGDSLEDDSCHQTETYYGSIPPDFTSTYYSFQQASVTPACIIRPHYPSEVSSAMKIIRESDCHFAIKSGGHNMNQGFSNVEGGITIDLVRMKNIEISEDEEIVKMGEVYEVVEPRGLMVVGGRDSTVGVGGFLLGDEMLSVSEGGISFLSQRYGWGSDNVRNFEIVFSNGTLANVNAHDNPDLYWALRGGGNNFGIVTRFDLQTYPQGPAWGGQNYYLFSDISAQRNTLSISPRPFLPLSLRSLTIPLTNIILKTACLLSYCTSTTTFLNAIQDLVTNQTSDTSSQFYGSIGYLAQYDLFAGLTCLTNSDGVANPSAFEGVRKLGAYSTNRNASMGELAKELTSMDVWGDRIIWATMTLYPHPELFQKILNLFLEQIETIKHVPGFLPSFVLQPLVPSVHSDRSQSPNGLSGNDGTLIVFNINIWWSTQASDSYTPLMQQSTHKLISKLTLFAKELGILHKYIYPNYADASQDVFAGYGEENLSRLRQVQEAYDPDGTWRRLQTGGFKI